MLKTYGHLGYAQGVSFSGMDRTFESKEIRRREFQGEAWISWGRPQNTRRRQGGRSILQNTALLQHTDKHHASKYTATPYPE